MMFGVSLMLIGIVIVICGLARSTTERDQNEEELPEIEPYRFPVDEKWQP